MIKPRTEDGVGRSARVMILLVLRSGLGGPITRSEALGVAGEVDEGGLGDFLGKLRRANLTKRGGMDEINVATDEFGEGVLGVVAIVAREQLQIVFAHFHKYIAADL